MKTSISPLTCPTSFAFLMSGGQVRMLCGACYAALRSEPNPKQLLRVQLDHRV